MNRNRRILLAVLAGVPLLALLVVTAFLVFFPADALRAELEKRASTSTGQNVRIGALHLRLRGAGLALVASNVRAESADGGQTITIPSLGLRVAILPLLRRQVRVSEAEAAGLLLELRPVARRAGASSADRGEGAGAAGIPGASGTTGAAGTSDAAVTPGAAEAPSATGRTPAALFSAPVIRLADARIVQEGPAGITTLSGITVQASFEGTGAGGQIQGVFRADTLRFAPRTAAGPPLPLPPLDFRFRTEVRLEPMGATTSLEGTVGGIPATGTIESRGGPAGWSNSGTVELARIGLDQVTGLLQGPQAAALREYQFAGQLEGGRLTFETVPDREATDYRFTGTLVGLGASLPGKGRIIDDGRIDLAVKPDDLALQGRLASGQARLAVAAQVLDFAAPRWTAQVELTGPAAEALRFAPPPAPPVQVQRGSVEAQLDLAGRVGEKALPAMSGTVRLSEVALTHPGVAVPVSRLDLVARLAGTSVSLEEGFIRAGRSDARFRGRIADSRKPALDLDLAAGTIDLDELFPRSGADGGGAAPGGGGARPGIGGATPGTAGATATAAAAPMMPVSGRITIDRLVREEMTITGVAAGYRVDAAGMSLNDVTGSVYGGTVSGDLLLKPAGPQALEYSGALEVSDMRAEEFLAAWTPLRGIEGKLKMAMTLSGRNGPGINPLSALTLLGDGLVFEGSLVNIPLVRRVSEALQFQEGAVQKLPFRTLRHRIRVENGLVRLDTLRVAQADADWTLGGQVGLDGRLDCPVRVRLSPALFRSGSDLRQAAELVAGAEGRIELGLKLAGTLTDPQVSVDIQPLLNAAEKAAVKQGKDRLRDEARKRLEGLFRKP